MYDLFTYLYYKNQQKMYRYTILIEWRHGSHVFPMFPWIVSFRGLERWQERFLLPDGGAMGSVGLSLTIIMASQPNPPRNKGLIAGLIKGHQY